MNDTAKDPDGQPEEVAPASPLTRLREARWLLLSAVVLGLVAVGLYDVPATAAAIGTVALGCVAALVPRRSRPRRVQVSRQRELRRMWPGTGMKVTVDALPNPCFVADGRGITRYINTAAMEYYGVVKPGAPLSFSLRAPSLLEAFDRVCTGGTSVKINWNERAPTEAWFEAYLSPVFMPGPNPDPGRQRSPDFVLVVIRDLTEQRRLERMRTDFVANASHELRTPLASLTGFIETLQGPAREDAKARDRFLEIMLDQAGRMRRLIDDILSLSRIELKANVRPVTEVDLVEIVKHTIDALAPLARDLEMDLRTECLAEEMPIRGDRDELIQVVENLVENALKYGNEGHVVDVRLEPGAGTDGPSLVVRDYGPGIPDEHLPRLTERFYRVDVDSSRTMKGTGLGLAIVKHILARHRARLEIESTPGAGALFRVRFPSIESA